jgi:hypothetical protein
MSVKLVLLKSGETLITDAKELISDDKLCGYLFDHPHIVNISSSFVLTNDPERIERKSHEVDVSFTPWFSLSSDKKFPVPTDWVVTIAEPLSNIKKLYEDRINGQSSEVSFTED